MAKSLYLAQSGEANSKDTQSIWRFGFTECHLELSIRCCEFFSSVSSVQASIFGLGLALSTAVQLRFAGPVGPSELLLALWLGLIVNNWLVHSGVLTGTPSLSAQVLRFWGILFAAIAVGLLVGQWTGLANEDQGLRDLIALGFAAVVSIVISSVRADSEVWNRVVSAHLLTATVCMMGVLGMVAVGVTPIIDPWYQAIRFRAWSENPNQLALMLIPIPFLTLWAYKQTSSLPKRIWLVNCLLVSLIAGVLSLSEALYIAWGVSFGILLAVPVVLYFRSPTRDPLIAVWRKISLPAIVSGVVLALVLPFALRAIDIVTSIYELGGQGDMRFAVWRHGLEAASYSPLFGLGPGSFSGPTAPFQETEAHSTFIDILTQTGIIGLTAYLALLVILGRIFIVSRQMPFIGAFIALIIFSSFHYVLRQPTFWLTLILMARLVLAAEPESLRKRVRDS
jgi:O-antigen ligase